MIDVDDMEDELGIFISVQLQVMERIHDQWHGVRMIREFPSVRLMQGRVSNDEQGLQSVSVLPHKVRWWREE